jgi:hypothetical protein
MKTAKTQRGSRRRNLFTTPRERESAAQFAATRFSAYIRQWELHSRVKAGTSLTTKAGPTNHPKEKSVSQLRVAKFLRPNHDGLNNPARRERVLAMNDTIHAVSHAGESFAQMDDGEGVIAASTMLNLLLEELEASIFEEVDDE